MYLSFIQIAYICTLPLLLALQRIHSNRADTYHRLIAVSNLLLIGYSVFLIRQLIGLYQLSSLFPSLQGKNQEDPGFALIRLSVVMVLPFFALLKKVRENLLFSLLMIVLLYWHSPFQYWNLYLLWIKIPAYLSLFSTAYALLWLFHKMPDSTRN
ncbi:MAG: hypothetical protein KGO92_07475 [Bacteroidota bacterium]|nr:hypothetical protein [Bacteroidota bacterium]